mmetsp:Transcript_155617/g.290448  ORF Transcript_155617/g.290448 Transcript_155617/m.290448 type:complete len:320 (+) Transcript_155617:112-1071(+)
MKLTHIVLALASFEPLLATGSTELRRNWDLLEKVGIHQGESSLETASPVYHSVESEEQHLYQLRMCNAYAHSKPLEMRRVQAPQLIEYPLPYKECHDYTLPLKTGDELRFRAGEQVVGTFVVRGLPKPGALLLIVPHRRESTSAALAFDSHVFARGSKVSQVAMVDAFCSPVSKASVSLKETSAAHSAFVRLTDASDSENRTSSLRQSGSKQKPRKQDLRFNTVVELKPGSYQMTLGTSTKGSSQARQVKLNALEHEAYVAIRLGFNDGKGASWPEELVVFPRNVLLESSQNSAACLPRAFSWGAFALSSAAALVAMMQ